MGAIQEFTYDNTNQITSEETADGTTTLSYDANGNRAMTGYVTGDGAGGSPDNNRLTTDGVWNYSYDDEGNLIQKVRVGGSEKWQFQFDHLNNLTRIDRKTNGTTIDLTVLYTYDAWGNRIAKSVDADGAGGGSAVVMKFALDGWNPSKAGGIGQEAFDVRADLASNGYDWLQIGSADLHGPLLGMRFWF